MKAVLVLCIIGAAIYLVQAHMTPEQITENNKLKKECMEKSGATDDMIDNVTKHKIFADNAEMAAYARCRFEKFGLMDHDGTMHRDVLIKKAVTLYSKPEDEVETIIDKCIEKTKDMDNVDKKAYTMFKCYINSNDSS